MPYLLKPKVVRGAGRWRPSAAEQSDGFIQWIFTPGELDGKLTEYRARMEMHQLTCQPIVMAVGPAQQLTAVYVIIDTVKYEVIDLFGAVDLCFKSFYALNAKYSSSLSFPT